MVAYVRPPSKVRVIPMKTINQNLVKLQFICLCLSQIKKTSYAALLMLYVMFKIIFPLNKFNFKIIIIIVVTRKSLN